MSIGSKFSSHLGALPTEAERLMPLVSDLLKKSNASESGSEIATRQQPLSTKKDRVTTIPGVQIQATGFATASCRVDNVVLAEAGYDAAWIEKRTGIGARFHVRENEATSDLAIRAAQDCLSRAGVSADEVDLIIVATMTPDHLTPSTACIVQAALGCKAAAMDLNAACSGFIYALVTASQFVKSGCSRMALVIGTDVLTNITNPEDHQTFPLFGDGAGAALISASEESCDTLPASGILAYRLASEGELGKALLIPGGGSRMPASQSMLDRKQHYLQMDGRTVFKWAVNLIPEIVGEILFRAEMSLEEIDLFIPHQANIRIIDAAIEKLGIDREKVFVNLDRYGNTSAASIPIALSEAIDQGRIQRGAHVLMVGFGGGLTWGACLFRW
jgi:3-oxoacyl-[acyl-carrier-protein] synthase III